MAAIGLVRYMNIVINKGDSSTYYSNIGDFIDPILTANASSVQQLNPATQYVSLSDPTLTINGLDQQGTPSASMITGVHRVDVTKLTDPYNIFFLHSLQGLQMICGSDTPVATRIDNVIAPKNASDWQVDDLICCSCLSYSVDTSGTYRPAMFQTMFNMPIPGIVTYTWGQLDGLTYRDCQAFYDVCNNYPDDVDSRDAAIFNAVLSEQTVYDALVDKQDRTDNELSLKRNYLYWIYSDLGCFSAFPGAPVYGTPVPGPQNKPKSPDSSELAKVSRKKANKEEILKKYGITVDNSDSKSNELKPEEIKASENGSE